MIKNKPKVSIIVYSSDQYADCWDPFFTLFKKNFSTRYEHEILLLNNTKEFSVKDLEIRVIKCGKNTIWSKRLQTGLLQAKYELIFLIGDDFFLLSKMNPAHFEEQIENIIHKNKIDHIRLLHKPDKFKTEKSGFSNLEKISKYTKYRFLFAPGLWKKKALLNYLVDFESPFMAEKMGTYRSWILDDGFYCLSKEFISVNGRLYDCGSSGVIVKGKWASWSVPLLNNENLGINFDKRGIRKEEEKKSAMNAARLHQVKNFRSTLKSYLSVLRLSIMTALNK